jgi:hypothetical protein
MLRSILIRISQPLGIYGFIYLDVGKFPIWEPSDHPDYKNISYHGLQLVVKMDFFLLFRKWEAI